MAELKLSSSDTVLLAPAGTASPVGWQVIVSGSTDWVGSIVLKQNTAPPGSTRTLVSVALQNPNTGEEIAAGTAITASGARIVSPTGGDLYVVYTHTSGTVNVRANPATQGVTDNELETAFLAAGFETSGQDTPVTQLSAAVAMLLGQSLDVRAFGAVGDGVTDDTEAIQAADAASGPLYFPPGAYRLTSSVTITSGCVFADGATLEPDAGVTVTLSGPVENVGTRVASEDADGWVAVAGQVNGAITTTQPVPLDRRVNYYAFGDSFTAGTGASSTPHNYVQILGQAIESTITNRGIGARGVYRAWRELCVYLPINLRQASLVTLMAGLNDIRHGGTDVKTMRKIENVHRAFIALALAELVYAANDALVTAAGTWTLPTLVADGLVTKAGTVDVAGTALQAVSGSTLSYTFTADNLVIWPWLSDGVTYEYGPATITIDGTLVETYDPNDQTDGISDPDNDNARVPGALVYTGLGSGSHTVVIAPTSATLPFVVDCVGHLAKPQNAQPVIVAGPPYMLAATYGSSAPYDQATPALITDVNAAIRGVCEEFTPWPVKFFRVSDYFDKQNNSDGLHPDDAGYQQIAAGFLAQIRPTLKSAYRGTGNVSTAVGEASQATGEAATAFGNSAVASDQQAMALGYAAVASGAGGHALGIGAVASGASTTAAGYSADATGNNSVAVGADAQSTGSGSTALGRSATVSHDNATAVGKDATSTRTLQVTLGTATDEVFIPGRLSIVDGMTAPSAIVGAAQIYIDSVDGDLKIIFGDGTVKTIVVDT